MSESPLNIGRYTERKDQCCGNCTAFVADVKMRPDGTFGTCRARPPVVDFATFAAAAWPIVDKSLWCRKWSSH